MRPQTLIAAGFCLLVAGGCASVRHDFQPYRAAGSELPIEVEVRGGDAGDMHGTVHYRRDGRGVFMTQPLELRANRLSAILPTADAHPEDVVEYYIDVNRDGKLVPLGTPGQPYVVTFLDADQMILTHLTDECMHRDAHHEVRLSLLTDGQRIEQPEVVYQMPGVPGNIRSGMEPDRNGNFHVVIPADTVTPGTWRYAIEVPINGRAYRFPERGYRTFIVEQGYPPKIATGAVK